jgi:hypothetical protein
MAAALDDNAADYRFIAAPAGPAPTHLELVAG